MRPKDIQHAGKPQASVIPKAAEFLLRTEDRGREEDADPTDGGQEDQMAEAGMEGPDLVTQVRDLMAQYGPEQLQAAMEACMAEMQPAQPELPIGGEELEEENQASITA